MVSKTIVAQVTLGSNPSPSAANEQVRGRIALSLSLTVRSGPERYVMIERAGQTPKL
jgi:hypothetical protein